MNGFDHRDEAAASWAIKLSEGGLSKTEQAAFKRWLDEDPRNVDALSEIVGAWQTIDHYATAAPMMDLRNAALAYTRARLHWPAGATIPPPRLCPLAAACVSRISHGITIWHKPQRQDQTHGLREARP